MAGRDDAKAFEQAMREVDPLADSVERVPARRPQPKAPALAAAQFELTSGDDHQQGLAKGADPQQLARLEAGEWLPELTLDLHGLTAEAARVEVVRGLRQARRGGLRVVRIVHGRGLRSAAGPVLKMALPQWLALPPHGQDVLAFTTAGRLGAGGGATLVLLRRRKKSAAVGNARPTPS